MPTIESRKTREAQYIDMKTYENLKRTGLIRRFVVIDDSDLEPTAVRESRKLVEFEEKDSLIKPEKIYGREELEKMLKADLVLLYNQEIKKYDEEIDKKLTKQEIIDKILLEPLKMKNQ